MSDEDQLKQQIADFIDSNRGPLVCKCGFTNSTPMTVLEHILFWDKSPEHSLATKDEANDHGQGIRTDAGLDDTDGRPQESDDPSG